MTLGLATAIQRASEAAHFLSQKLHKFRLAAFAPVNSVTYRFLDSQDPLPPAVPTFRTVPRFAGPAGAMARYVFSPTDGCLVQALRLWSAVTYQPALPER